MWLSNNLTFTQHHTSPIKMDFDFLSCRHTHTHITLTHNFQNLLHRRLISIINFLIRERILFFIAQQKSNSYKLFFRSSNVLLFERKKATNRRLKNLLGLCLPPIHNIHVFVYVCLPSQQMFPV